MENKYKSWMVTILSDKEGLLPLPSIQKTTSVFNELGSEWAFQEEQHSNAEVHKTHYQCCLQTTVRIRKTTLLKRLAENLDHPVERIRVEKMEGTWEQAITYCTKDDTRVGKPNVSSSIYSTYAGDDISFLNEEEKRFPWQSQILEELFEKVPTNFKSTDDRSIYWITDFKGNSGKSLLVKYLCFNNDAVTKLPFGTANQIRSAVASQGAKSLYFIDMPRTLGDDDSVNDMISVIEDIKNGFVVSAFYGQYKKLLFSPPSVVVFSNMDCPVKKLSQDRWKCYIIEGKKLIPKFTMENYSREMNEDFV